MGKKKHNSILLKILLFTSQMTPECHIGSQWNSGEELAKRKSAGLQRRGDSQVHWLQHLSLLAWSCGWKNDIIKEDPYC